MRSFLLLLCGITADTRLVGSDVPRACQRPEFHLGRGQDDGPVAHRARLGPRPPSFTLARVGRKSHRSTPAPPYNPHNVAAAQLRGFAQPGLSALSPRWGPADHRGSADETLFVRRTDDVMTSKASATVLTMVFLIGAGAISGQSGPRLPYVDYGACPFEGCTYRTWSVLADTRLLTDRRDNAAVVARVQRGATVRGLTGVVVTTKLGRAVVVRQITIGRRRLAVRPDDTVSLLHYLGEGYFKYWLRGAIDEEFIPDQAGCRNNSRLFNECSIQMGELPETVWWAKIRTRKGQEGWTRELGHFGNKDRFG